MKWNSSLEILYGLIICRLFLNSGPGPGWTTTGLFQDCLCKSSLCRQLFHSSPRERWHKVSAQVCCARQSHATMPEQIENERRLVDIGCRVRPRKRSKNQGMRCTDYCTRGMAFLAESHPPPPVNRSPFYSREPNHDSPITIPATIPRPTGCQEIGPLLGILISTWDPCCIDSVCLLLGVL